MTTTAFGHWRVMACLMAVLLGTGSRALEHEVEPALPVTLSATGGELTVTLRAAPIGLYSVYLHGRIEPAGRERLERVWQPCPMEFTATNAASERVGWGRLLLKQSFETRRLQGFHLHVPAPGDYRLRFRLLPAARETAIVERLEVVDQLADLPAEAVKRQQNLAATASLRQPGVEPTPERIARDRLIWDALPPLNVHLQVHGQVAQFARPPAAAKMPEWQFAAWQDTHPRYFINRMFTPLTVVNTVTGETISHEQMLAGEPWPDARWQDDGTGFFFAKADYPELAHDIYTSPRANLLGRRVQLYLGLLGAWDYRGASLIRKAVDTGDANLAHDATIALVRVAYDWPALEMNLHEHRLCTHSPDFEYNTDWSMPGRRNGKYFYSGWSGPMAVDLMTDYDALFPYLDGNQAVADAVNRLIPWVKTPADVVRLLDQRLVFASIRDYRRNVIRTSGVEDVAGEVLGPHPLTQDLFDLTAQHANIYPYEGTYQELYATALARLGHYHIGSTGYASGDAANLVTKAQALRHGREAGLKLPMDLSDVERYPKVRRAADFLIDQWVAGGFWLTVGNASGGSHTSFREGMKRLATWRDSSAAAVELWGDPRHAWLLAQLHGDADPEVVKLAASVRHPVLHNPSRVLPGWAGILEHKVESTDPLEKAAAFMVIGLGQGHAHHDFLDLNLFAMGLPVATDLAVRDEGGHWSRPGGAWSFVHNHAIGHDTDDPRRAGEQTGEAWLRAFAPPLMRGSYVDREGRVRLDRDVVLMEIEETGTCYAFDLQTLSGGATHTWGFHGVQSEELELNVPMREETVRWTDRLLAGSQRAGKANDTLQAVWTATREPREYPHDFKAGGVVRTVALEPSVLGDRYDPALPPVRVRATLLGHEGADVLTGKPYSEPYNYAFPFLWVQHPGGPEASVYPAIYEWYRGEQPAIAGARLVRREPLTVEVTTATGQVDTYRREGEALAIVSRDAAGLRWAMLAHGTRLEEPGLLLETPVAALSTPIVAIDYVARRLRTEAALPAIPGALVGNPGHQAWLELSGAGQEFTWRDDLLAHEGRITRIEIAEGGALVLETNQKLFHAGAGNRQPEGFTVTNEHRTWHFRGGQAVHRPADGALTTEVFADANGDGRIHALTYEIGIGDTVTVPASIVVRRAGAGYEILTNVPVTGQLGGKKLSMPASPVWQRVP